MYQAFATLALLLVFLHYCYGCYGGCLAFIITKDKQITYVIVPNTALNVKQSLLHMRNFHHK